jgi:hypothetical protein
VSGKCTDMRAKSSTCCELEMRMRLRIPFRVRSLKNDPFQLVGGTSSEYGSRGRFRVLPVLCRQVGLFATLSEGNLTSALRGTHAHVDSRPKHYSPGTISQPRQQGCRSRGLQCGRRRRNYSTRHCPSDRGGDVRQDWLPRKTCQVCAICFETRPGVHNS